MEVADAIADLSANAFPFGLRAALLTGSLARGEGTWIREGARVRLAGDADLLVVFNDDAALPTADRVDWLKRAVEDRLAAVGIEAHLGLSPVQVGYLRRLQPNIFSYELIAHGKVLWGDPQILKQAPALGASEIPLEDGFRLLMNRMIELLQTICEDDELTASSMATRYCAMKLWLDMATSYLVFERQYVPSYRDRAARLRKLAAEPFIHPPIPMNQFAQTVASATRCKLGESADSTMREFSDLDALVGSAHALWRWELERLTAPGASDDDLMCQWIAAEPIVERMRGWAGVVKRAGITRTMAGTAAWIDLARKGSPRRLTYGAASKLLFAFPSLAKGSLRSGDACWDRLRRRLPIVDSPDNRSLCDAPRRLGRAIAFNYNLFLAPTRS
jgi:hypothetical protein